MYIGPLLRRPNIDYLVVGANAWYLVLDHGFGLRILRATLDLDFAIDVGEWGAYQALKETLLLTGEEKTGAVRFRELPVDSHRRGVRVKKFMKTHGTNRISIPCQRVACTSATTRVLLQCAAINKIGDVS